MFANVGLQSVSLLQTIQPVTYGLQLMACNLQARMSALVASKVPQIFWRLHRPSVHTAGPHSPKITTLESVLPVWRVPGRVFSKGSPMKNLQWRVSISATLGTHESGVWIKNSELSAISASKRRWHKTIAKDLKRIAFWTSINGAYKWFRPGVWHKTQFFFRFRLVPTKVQTWNTWSSELGLNSLNL